MGVGPAPGPVSGPHHRRTQGREGGCCKEGRPRGHRSSRDKLRPLPVLLGSSFSSVPSLSHFLLKKHLDTSSGELLRERTPHPHPKAQLHQLPTGIASHTFTGISDFLSDL